MQDVMCYVFYAFVWGLWLERLVIVGVMLVLRQRQRYEIFDEDLRSLWWWEHKRRGRGPDRPCVSVPFTAGAWRKRHCLYGLGEGEIG